MPVLTYGEDTESGLNYMVLPYFAGGTLSARIREQAGPLPLTAIQGYLTPIAEALDYAHSQGVVHRDIKPANILLDVQGHPYLSDFSIARLLAEVHTKLTTTGQVMGTLAYMAPEQFQGGAVGSATDLYSLGMVLYEMVTGRVAFEGSTMVELMRQQTQEPPPPPRTLRPDLPEPAEAAILYALDKQPDRRFPTAGALASAFSEGLQGRWSAGLTAHVPSADHAPSAEASSAESASAAVTLPRMVPTDSAKGSSPATRGRRWLVGTLAAVLIGASILALSVNGGAAVTFFRLDRLGTRRTHQYPAGPAKYQH